MPAWINCYAMKTENILPDLTTPRDMAIVNVTPDSFFSGSRTPDAEAIERRVREAADAGCDLFDVGGYSSRSGAAEVTSEEEWRRVEAGVAAVRRIAPTLPVSVDTFRSEVAARAIERYGPLIINDISAGELDPAMPAVAAKYGVPYIAMHMKGDPKPMQSLPDYKRDITAEVVAYFEARVAALLAAGIAREHLVLDPGFGFAKTTEQNYELLAGLHRLCALGYPVLAGVSRKSMIYKVLDTPPAQALADATDTDAIMGPVVIDTVGVKGIVCERAFELAREHGFYFVGAHPMAGTQYSGYANSRADLFQGAPLVLVPPAVDDALKLELLGQVREMVRPLGFGKFSVTSAAEHDRVIAFTSQLAHVVSNAYVKSPTAPVHPSFSAGSYRDLTRVAHLNPRMWSELMIDDADALAFEIDHLIDSLGAYSRALKDRDQRYLENLLAEGDRIKRALDDESAH